MKSNWCFSTLRECKWLQPGEISRQVVQLPFPHPTPHLPAPLLFVCQWEKTNCSRVCSQMRTCAVSCISYPRPVGLGLAQRRALEYQIGFTFASDNERTELKKLCAVRIEKRKTYWLSRTRSAYSPFLYQKFFFPVHLKNDGLHGRVVSGPALQLKGHQSYSWQWIMVFLYVVWLFCSLFYLQTEGLVARFFLDVSACLLTSWLNASAMGLQQEEPTTMKWPTCAGEAVSGSTCVCRTCQRVWRLLCDRCQLIFHQS